MAPPPPAGQDLTPDAPVAVRLPAPGTSPPGRQRRRVLLPAVAAILVAVLLVVGLLLTGVLPGSHSGSGGSFGEALSYSAARSLANAAAAGAAGSPWNLFAASGVDERTNVSFGIAFLARLYAVGLPDIHYLTPARPGIPPFDGSISSGLSPWWLFQYDNGTTTARNETVILGVIVANGTATAVATFSSALDLGVPSVTLPGTGIIDSPAAVAAAVASNTSFVDAHPDLNASFLPQFLRLGPGWVWLVTFTTCGPFEGSTSSGTSYFVEVNATSGTVPGSVPPMSGPC